MDQRVDVALAIGLLLVTVTVVATGCKTPDDGQPQGTVETASDGADALADLLDTDAETLISTVESLRDRSFEEPPSWKSESGALETASPDQPPRDERVLISRLLFGLEDAPESVPAPAFERLAQYDPESHTLVFRKDPPDPASLEFAVVVALVDALETQHFDFATDASTMDGRLAADTAPRAGQMLAAAGYLIRQRDDLSLQQFARRPDLSLQIAPLGTYLRRKNGAEPADIESPTDLAERIRAFTLREGLTLGAALFRSNSWSGVELLDAFDPESTADVVRPDRWMTGEGLGEWSWPETSSWNDDHPADENGRVGPAIISIWLGQVFRPDLARTVYSGWRSDGFHYGTFETEDEEGPAWRFEWVMQWDSPSSAQQIAGAFEKVLAREYETSGADEATYQVARKGLKVAVLLESAASPAPDDLPQEATYLLESNVTYQPRDPLPTSFVPTRVEEFRRAARKADLEQQSWSDPASGLSADLSPVGDWTTRSSRTLPLRWFAKRGDGYVLQLTTELTNPLGASFGTDPYLDDLRAAFTSSLDKANFENQGTTDQPLSGTLRFSVDGLKKGRDWRLEAWQMRHGDVIATLSLQGPASGFDGPLEATRDVATSLERTTDTPPGADDEDDTSDDDGTIEYEIEEE